MPIRIYGKVRKTIKGNQINPFYCDWRPDDSWITINIITASRERGRDFRTEVYQAIELYFEQGERG